MIKFILILFFPLWIYSQSLLVASNCIGIKPTFRQISTILRDSVLVQLKEYPTQVKMLEAYEKQLQSEYDFKKMELDTRVKDCQDNEDSFKDALKQLKIREVQKLDEELKRFSHEAEQKLLKKVQELLQPMNVKINKTIKAVALKQGYTQITDRKLVYFSLPICDATKLVIEEANK